MDILFIGTASVIPEANRDTACCIINENVMLDCGWWGSFGMQRFGLNPMSVEHLLITTAITITTQGFPIYYIIRTLPAGKQGKEASCLGTRRGNRRDCGAILQIP